MNMNLMFNAIYSAQASLSGRFASSLHAGWQVGQSGRANVWLSAAPRVHGRTSLWRRRGRR